MIDICFKLHDGLVRHSNSSDDGCDCITAFLTWQIGFIREMLSAICSGISTKGQITDSTVLNNLKEVQDNHC